MRIMWKASQKLHELAPRLEGARGVLCMDFDGTMHAENERPFSKSMHLERALRLLPGVVWVATSLARQDMTLAQLSGWLMNEDLMERFAGATPLRANPSWEGAKRSGEIRALMEKTGYAGTWLAVDDRTDIFSKEDIIDGRLAEIKNGAGMASGDPERVRDAFLALEARAKAKPGF